MKEMDKPERRLSDEDLAEVLNRAAEIDARMSQGISIEDARRIAIEAGISPSAISAAIESLGARPAEAAAGLPPAAPRRWVRSSVSTGVLVGSALGTLLSIARLNIPFVGDAGLFTLLGVALLPALAMAMVVDGPGRHRRFQTMNLALWITTSLIWASVGGPTREFEDLFIVGGWLAAMDALLGAGTIFIRELPEILGDLRRRVAPVFRTDPQTTIERAP